MIAQSCRPVFFHVHKRTCCETRKHASRVRATRATASEMRYFDWTGGSPALISATPPPLFVTRFRPRYETMTVSEISESETIRTCLIRVKLSLGMAPCCVAERRWHPRDLGRKRGCCEAKIRVPLSLTAALTIAAVSK